MTAAPYIFRVIREQVGGETVRVLLEPYSAEQRIDLQDGDELITGTLEVSPWPDPRPGGSR